IPSNPKINENVIFNSTSYDLDGFIANYTWNFGDGSIAYGRNVSHVYYNEGSYIVNLTIKDDDGAIAWIAKEVVVSSIQLLVDFDYTPKSAISKHEIHFIDLSAGASLWHWDFGDNTTSNEKNPLHVYPIGNLYNVTLTIYNGSMNASISKIVRVDTFILLVKNENNVVNYIPWLSNATTASQLASMIGEDIMPEGSVVSKWNTSKGAFDSYIVGISPPEYDFVIEPYDVVVLRVANSGSFNETAIKLQDRIVELIKNENNVVNHIAWSCLYATTASQLASMIGEDIMPEGSVVSKWNTSKGAFDSYIVGISPPEYDFVIEPGDCIVLRVASPGSFIMEVIK
ncbi:MAG: PKD domain-containing protein, partial [Thermoplasmata archaeon]|nr:PKD domain-containing protein [Thermoplasmata archaeon]